MVFHPEELIVQFFKLTPCALKIALGYLSRWVVVNADLKPRTFAGDKVPVFN